MRWLSLLLLFMPGLAQANDWDALSEPGAIAIMRHALAPGTGDPANLTIVRAQFTTPRSLVHSGTLPCPAPNPDSHKALQLNNGWRSPIG
jgi:hypothetical protein